MLAVVRSAAWAVACALLWQCEQQPPQLSTLQRGGQSVSHRRQATEQLATFPEPISSPGVTARSGEDYFSNYDELYQVGSGSGQRGPPTAAGKCCGGSGGGHAASCRRC